MSQPDPNASAQHDPYAALRIRDYRLYLPGNIFANLGMRMQSAAVLWEIYERTDSALHVGYVGLAQILPVIVLAMPGGHAADHYSRKRLIMIAEVIIASCSFGLALNSMFIHSVPLIYLALFLTGVARSFQQPARASFVPQIVPLSVFSNAVTWNSTGFQLSSIVGPALAGGIIWLTHSATLVYVVDASSALTFFAVLAFIPDRPIVNKAGAFNLRSVVAGLEFVWQNKIVLGALTLDMVAVLLGGAVALLPIYARDILMVGPRGYGALLAAPSVGALLMSVILAHRPPLERAGRDLLWSVAGFGVATIVFGFSQSFALSIVMLFLTGVLDTVSVVIRHTLVQIVTPDTMRGRVSAVNGIFIGASNELGAFRAGLVASWAGRLSDPITGTMFSAVSGGIGTILAVAFAAVAWPTLRRFGRLVGPEDAGAPGAFPIVEAQQAPEGQAFEEAMEPEIGRAELQKPE